jgi:hypothetical protein
MVTQFPQTESVFVQRIANIVRREMSSLRTSDSNDQHDVIANRVDHSKNIGALSKREVAQFNWRPSTFEGTMGNVRDGRSMFAMQEQSGDTT